MPVMTYLITFETGAVRMRTWKPDHTLGNNITV